MQTPDTIQTPVGIPSEMSFQLPSSMVPSRKFEYRVPPAGQSSFNTAGQTITFKSPDGTKARALGVDNNNDPYWQQITIT